MPGTTAERIRKHRGPPVLGLGFRPFFLVGAVWAVFAMLGWLLMLSGLLLLPTHLAPLDWHVHELLYGYLTAIVAGFLLTAVPNWTGRLPVTGVPLLAFVLVWLAGRIAVTTGQWLGPLAAGLLDLAFLACLIAIVTRELLAGANRRNLPVLLLVGLLFIGNAVFHIEANLRGFAEYGTRLGIAAILLLLMLIGGRIVPSFTRNWLAKGHASAAEAGRLPAPMNLFDGFAVAFAGLTLVGFVASPWSPTTAVLALLAGLLHVVRLGRWAGDRTFAEPLVTVLHVGYVFVPVGFLLLAASHVDSAVQPVAALHAWTVGGIGVMTLAVMTRASLGHSGRALTAGPTTSAIFVLIVASALARIVDGTALGFDGLSMLAGTLWVLAFMTFTVAYWPILTRPRQQA